MTVAAVVTLALGIGANTTVFSVVRAIFVDPFVFHDQKNTVIILAANPAQGHTKEGVSLRRFSRLARALPFVRSIGYHDAGHCGPHRSQRARAFESLSRFERVLFAFRFQAFTRPYVHRRRISRRSTAFGDREPCFLGNRNSGRDPAAIGKILHLNGEAFNIVGVMPASFWMPSRHTTMWLPLTPSVSSPEVRSVRDGLVLAHLRMGITLDHANQELAGVNQQLAQLYPLANTGWSARAWEPLPAVMGPNDQVLMVVLFGVVGALLLVACSNVANLLLAQAAARRKEMAIRTAVGATRWHLMQQSLAESVVLAAMAASVGLLIGFWAKDFFVAIYPSEILISGRVMDPFVLGFCLLVSILAALFFGLAPAWIPLGSIRSKD